MFLGKIITIKWGNITFQVGIIKALHNFGLQIFLLIKSAKSKKHGRIHHVMFVGYQK